MRNLWLRVVFPKSKTSFMVGVDPKFDSNFRQWWKPGDMKKGFKNRVGVGFSLDLHSLSLAPGRGAGVSWALHTHLLSEWLCHVIPTAALRLWWGRCYSGHPHVFAGISVGPSNQWGIILSSPSQRRGEWADASMGRRQACIVACLLGQQILWFHVPHEEGEGTASRTALPYLSFATSQAPVWEGSSRKGSFRWSQFCN